MPRISRFAEAAFKILHEAGQPLHYKEIAHRADQLDLLPTGGKTKHESLNAKLSVDIKALREASRFVRTAPGTFGLRSWDHVREYDREEDGPLVRVVSMPTYQQVVAVLRVCSGRRRSAIQRLQRAVDDLRGSRENPEDFSDPATWIPSRLAEADRPLAAALWAERLNPRYFAAPWTIATAHRLLADESDVLHLTDAGQDYLNSATSPSVRGVEEAEGVLKLLALVARHAPAETADLIADWTAWLREETNVAADSSARAALRTRLEYLQQRSLISRSGSAVELTESGRSWLAQDASAAAPSASVGTPTDRRLWDLAAEQRSVVREQLHARIAGMDPFGLERLVKDLLDAMGYREVEVTTPSHDRGVDVVGNIDIGITSVREVVQVKRVRRNIQRPVLDQLRGSLYKFRAFRGTIITTGSFSKGTIDASLEVGGAPITLIDGRRLVDLLIKHGIGVRKESVELWELDAGRFAVGDENELLDEDGD